MKIRTLLFTCFFLFSFGLSYAQITFSVTVNDADIATDCTDFFGDPDPLFEVDINGAGVVTYPQVGACFTALPNVQYTSPVYNCTSNIPPTFNVCFEVYENDGIVPCSISRDCTEQICEDFPLPTTPSADYTMTIPGGGESSGTLDFTVDFSGLPNDAPNNMMCDAIDFGELNLGNTLGDASVTAFSNFCADNVGDINPCDFDGGVQCNERGVWFTFTTGDEDISRAVVSAFSNPGSANDDGPFLLQLGIFEALDGTCDGDFGFIQNITGFSTPDEIYPISCLTANTTYYIMIDGAAVGSQPLEGNFGLTVEAEPFEQAPDLLCDALDMGTVPLAGSITLPELLGTQCATGSGDLTPDNFTSQNGVWLQFTPPPTGHIFIDGVTDPLDPFSLQIAVFESESGTCAGPFDEKISQWTPDDGDNESVEVSCLDPDGIYYILIDGISFNDPGYFDLTITDAGNNTPETTNTEVICAGDFVNVAGNIYDMSGFFSDTLPIGGGCTQIINTDLTVLEELIIDFEIIDPASGEEEPDGAALITAVGGDGNYTYTWSNGLDIPDPTTLLGGQNYCVTVSDDTGCEDFLCFDMPFIEFVTPTVTDGAVLCNGDTDGTVSFFVEGGTAPYVYQWEAVGGNLDGNGMIAAENEDVIFSDLPAGTYSITVADAMTDTIFQAVVTEPAPLTVEQVSLVNASCFGECDGQITVGGAGGTPFYTYAWNTGATVETIDDLCAGEYAVTITDGNGCEATATYLIEQPEEIILTASVNQNVSCFNGNDGSLSASATGTPMSFAWSSGENTADISDKPAGTYTVTVTDVSGCTATAQATVTEPNAPLEVSLAVTEEITCGGDRNGAIGSTVSGPAEGVIYLWSSGELGENISNLPAGTYGLTVENVNGCTAEAEIEITEPEEIFADLTTKNVNCAEGDFSGALYVESVTGGEEPYVYSVDSQSFATADTFLNLAAGAYEFTVEDALGCVKNFDFSILPPPELIVDLGENRTVILGETLELDPQSANENVVYTWTSSDILPPDCLPEQCESITVQPTGTTLYSVFARDTVTQCTAEASVEIMVNRARFVFFPDAFSPNDDGINDRYLMFGERGVEAVVSFRIYNRYGGLVYTASDMQSGDMTRGWDGYFNGRKAETGVYVYQAEILFIDGETEVFAGDLTLVR